jgi:hypothetical protein
VHTAIGTWFSPAVRRLSLVAAVMLAALGFALDAEATRRLPQTGPGEIAVAVSRFGNGTVTGPVRLGARGGLEVRLPHGTWVACRRSCSETLRVETVDIFENKGDFAGYGTLQNECGIFGCLDF